MKIIPFPPSYISELAIIVDWEQRNWSDTVDISNDMVDPRNGIYDNLPHIGPGNIESFTGRLLNNIKTVKEDNLISGKFHFHKDDIIYGKINPQLGKYIYSPYEGLASADAYILTTKNGLNRKFLFVLLQTNHFYQYSVSVSMRSGMPKINRNELNMYSFTVPSEIEQEEIGLFFFKLDKIVALHQRKLDALKRLKEAYLQDMFPMNGESVPKLRFANFEGDWKQRKLGDLGSVAMNRRIFKEQTAEIGEVPFYKIGTFGGEPDAFISRKLFEEYKAKYSYPKVGDILLSASGSIGRTVEYTGEDEYFQDSNIVWLKHNQRLDNSFLKQFYSIVKWQGLEGSTIKRLYNKNILDTNISTPSLAEQQKIGQASNQLDDLITLQQHKLEQFQQLKQAYLQEMFI